MTRGETYKLTEGVARAFPLGAQVRRKDGTGTGTVVENPNGGPEHHLSDRLWIRFDRESQANAGGTYWAADPLNDYEVTRLPKDYCPIDGFEVGDRVQRTAGGEVGTVVGVPDFWLGKPDHSCTKERLWVRWDQRGGPYHCDPSDVRLWEDPEHNLSKRFAIGDRVVWRKSADGEPKVGTVVHTPGRWQHRSGPFPGRAAEPGAVWINFDHLHHDASWLTDGDVEPYVELHERFPVGSRVRRIGDREAPQVPDGTLGTVVECPESYRHWGADRLWFEWDGLGRRTWSSSLQEDGYAGIELVGATLTDRIRSSDGALIDAESGNGIILAVGAKEGENQVLLTVDPSVEGAISDRSGRGMCLDERDVRELINTLTVAHELTWGGEQE